MEKSFAGVDPYTAQKFSDLLGDFDVETGETESTPWARATFHPPADRPVGVVFDMLEKGSLGQVLGGFDPATALGSSASPAQLKELERQYGGCGSG
jgi:hypothetical protein